jgi:hypothetical protein
MSWDIFVLDLPSEAKTVADIPSNFRPSLIGKRSEIIDGIIDVMPTADFSDPSWGFIKGQDWSLEVNLGQKEDCDGFALRVRGGDAAVGAVAAILRRLNLRAFDAQTGEFFAAGESAIESFRQWRKYRDRVIRSNPM